MMDIEQIATGIVANVVAQTYARMAAEFAWSVDPSGESVPMWPSQSDVSEYVLARVDLSALGLSPAGEGLSAAQVVSLFTGAEQTALMAFILTPQEQPEINALRPKAMQLWMTLPFRSAPLTLDDPDFVQFVGALVTVNILTPERAGQVLAGQAPAE